MQMAYKLRIKFPCVCKVWSFKVLVGMGVGTRESNGRCMSTRTVNECKDLEVRGTGLGQYPSFQ
jgi:hypothetical protein